MQSASLSKSAHGWLGRATYGVNKTLAESFLSLGHNDEKRWEKYVEEQLRELHPKDEASEKRINALNLTTLQKPLASLWADHRLAAQELRKASKEQQKKGQVAASDRKAGQKERKEVALEPAHELELSTWMRIVYSQWQIYERMVGFWHDHFNIFSFEQRVAPGMMALNRDVIRPLALGNFRRLLGEVSRNPAMLYYLDNAYNQSGNPNENFARELFELHTLGAENYLGTIDRDAVTKDNAGRVKGYVDGDVYEAARCFTGWKVADGTAGVEKNNGEFIYHDPWHDRFQKIVLGQKIPEHQAPLKDGDDVLNILCSHPGTAIHLMRKLCRNFLSDQPPQDLVQRLAEAFLARKDSPTQIRDTLKDLLLSKEYLNSTASKFKRPVDFFASLIRTACPDFVPSEKFINVTQRSGQRLFGWKTPDGPPDRAEPWQSPQSLIDRWKTAQQLIKNEIPGCSFDAVLTSKDLPTSAQELAQQIARVLLLQEPDGDLLSTLVEVAAGGRQSSSPLPPETLKERAQWVAEICALSPAFQVRC